MLALLSTLTPAHAGDHVVVAGGRVHVELNRTGLRRSVNEAVVLGYAVELEEVRLRREMMQLYASGQLVQPMAVSHHGGHMEHGAHAGHGSGYHGVYLPTNVHSVSVTPQMPHLTVVVNTGTGPPAQAPPTTSTHQSSGSSSSASSGGGSSNSSGGMSPAHAALMTDLGKSIEGLRQEVADLREDTEAGFGDMATELGALQQRVDSHH